MDSDILEAAYMPSANAILSRPNCADGVIRDGVHCAGLCTPVGEHLVEVYHTKNKAADQVSRGGLKDATDDSAFCEGNMSTDDQQKTT